jgi:hypothetical protein
MEDSENNKKPTKDFSPPPETRPKLKSSPSLRMEDSENNKKPTKDFSPPPETRPKLKSSPSLRMEDSENNKKPTKDFSPPPETRPKLKSSPSLHMKDDENNKKHIKDFSPPPGVQRRTTVKTPVNRVHCPNCGVFGKDIRTMLDKTKILRYQGQTRIYAKKHVCKKCGTEF